MIIQKYGKAGRLIGFSCFFGLFHDTFGQSILRSRRFIT